MIDHELKLKNVAGIKTSINGPTFTHMMYADDVVLFSKASRKDAPSLVKTLENYCRWLRQPINRNKSGVFFSKYTQNQALRSIKGILQVKSLRKDVAYLGALIFLPRAPSKDFAFLQGKLEADLARWRSKCLSWARRKTLINSIA